MEKLILGIDTGGTYTDGVLITSESKEIVAEAKAFTTKEDLTVGIEKCLDNLNYPLDAVGLVCLSTTLATNAVVENLNKEVGLVTIDGGIPVRKDFPVTMSANLKGKMDIAGRELLPMDIEEVETAIEKMKDKVSAIAISGLASIKNPVQEITVKEIAEKILRVPVVCAHELSGSLGFQERTATAVLNAKLVPLICNLISSTNVILSRKGINAPMAIIKGDGYAMISEYAEFCPVETILSGPAASAFGGQFLTGQQEGIVVDIGGTTTDIVLISKGTAKVEDDGMNINGWKTNVKSVKVHTFGLGGDSYIRLKNKKLVFGPRKVKPLSVAAVENPKLINELRTYSLPANYYIKDRQPCDCAYIIDRNCNSLTEEEADVYEMLRDKSHSLTYIAHKLGTDVDALPINNMVEKSIIGIISLTPTDLLHASGEFVEWNREIAQLAVEDMALRMDMDAEAFIEKAGNDFVDEIIKAIMKSVIEGAEKKPSDNVDEFIRLMTKSNSYYNVSFALNAPVIGIGASANTWIRLAVDKMGAKYIGNEHGKIANAVGAAIGTVRERVEAVICYEQFTGLYISYMPGRRGEFRTLEDAKAEAVRNVEAYEKQMAQQMGVGNPEINVSINDLYIDSVSGKSRTFIKSTVMAELTGSVT